MIGASEGLTFRSVGGAGKFDGNWRSDAEIAASTSCAAASISRSRLNWIVIEVEPSALEDDIDAMSGIFEKLLSRGDATADAIVSGVAPGREAETTIVGKSTLGSSLTGRLAYPKTPNMTSAAMSNVVMTGFRIKISEIFIALERPPRPRGPSCGP